MPIVGFRFTSMEGKRMQDAPAIKGEIKVNSTPKITSVKEVNMPTFKQKAISVEFEFATNYDPKIAEIKITGDILYVPKNTVKVLKDWKNNKKLPDKINIEILNNMFRRCLIKISVIADDLQLPPPLQMPMVRPKGEEAGYVG